VLLEHDRSVIFGPVLGEALDETDESHEPLDPSITPNTTGINKAVVMTAGTTT
jgi:hypothetical protein